MKAYELAREQGIQTKELIRALKSEGFEVKALSKITDEMLKVVGKPEIKNDAKPEKPKESAKLNPESNGTKYYYAKSERLTFGGYKPEKRGLGFMESDKSLQFENHVLITNDENEQKFIEATNRFKLGDVKEIDSNGYESLMQELAAKRTRLRDKAAQMAGRSG